MEFVSILSRFAENLCKAEDGEKKALLPDDSGGRFRNGELPNDSGEKSGQNKSLTDTHANGKAENNEVNRIKCRNSELEGKTHPETGVPFTRRQVEVDGKQFEVIVPEFDSTFDAELPKEMYDASDREQFKECNKQLKEAVENDKDLCSKFDEEQLEQIRNGETPDGYTWHHDAEPGKMQLVDTETHQKTGHTGGRSIWGGGTENRF